MKKADLIKTANELNTILFEADKKEKGWIYTDSDEKELINDIKNASLWLYAEDELSDATANVLKELPWNDDDFKNLKKNQDPLPAFIRYGIVSDPVEELTEEKEEKPKKAKPKAKLKVVSVEEPKEYTKAPPPHKPQKRQASAYSMAIAIMGTKPNMSMAELYDVMRAKGFNIQAVGNSCKSARSIFRRCLYHLTENGFINKDKIKE